ncbi:MAG: thioredoxin family protein, partial [Sphingobium sp.]
QVRVAAVAERTNGNFRGVLSDGRHSVVLAAKASAMEAASSPEATELPDPPAKSASGAPEPLQAIPAKGGDGASAGATPALFAALMGALIGGLLLNLMPCVFPILSLKALSLARAGGNRSAARMEGIAYFAGSVATTALLGAILIGARALGHDIGWSFQLQDPRIILLLMLLSLGIALNLAGLFEIRGISISGGRLAQPGWSGAFGTGALAAVIATPCSGPFLGVALGAAMVLRAPATLAVFAGLGAGMALPFLAIAFMPTLQRMLPKPGRWMETFRRLLAIPMLLTAIGLAWVLGRQSGVDGLAIGLLLAALVALPLWWAGLRQSGGKETGVAMVAAAGAALLPLVIELPGPGSTPLVAAASESASAEPFSEARLAELRAQGKPVFVDMIADWCLICQVNKRVAIDRARTQAAFGRAGVTTLVGDWTRGDPAITRFLASRGRNSVPFYLFVTRGGEVRELPQVLTSDMLVDQATTS